MDPNAAPWRALETTAPPPTGAQAPESPSTPGVSIVAVGATAGTIALAAIAFLLAFGSGQGELRLAGGESVVPPTLEVSPGADVGFSGSELVVEVTGAIARPGVYRLPAGSRIGELISLAGGYGPRVDTDRAARELNLAAPLRDGDQVRVPSRDDPVSSPPAVANGKPGTGSGSTSGPIDLNTATSSELETLPGIGPVTAGKIISSREESPFTSVDELRGRKVVGEKTFEKIRDLVTVR